jgi:hypothetical protein
VVACVLGVLPTHVQLAIFLITMYITAMEAVKFHLILRICIYLFSLFLHSHSKTTKAQLVSEHVVTGGRVPHKVCVCVQLLGKFHFVTANPSTGNEKIQSVACRSVCRSGRIKQTFA